MSLSLNLHATRLAAVTLAVIYVAAMRADVSGRWSSIEPEAASRITGGACYTLKKLACPQPNAPNCGCIGCGGGCNLCKVQGAKHLCMRGQGCQQNQSCYNGVAQAVQAHCGPECWEPIACIKAQKCASCCQFKCCAGWPHLWLCVNCGCAAWQYSCYRTPQTPGTSNCNN
jgi:hypothetical protein